MWTGVNPVPTKTITDLSSQKPLKGGQNVVGNDDLTWDTIVPDLMPKNIGEEVGRLTNLVLPGSSVTSGGGFDCWNA